jgi:hypothetical protein
MGMSKEFVSWGLLVGLVFLEFMVATVGPGVRFRLRREVVVVYNRLGWMVAVECDDTFNCPIACAVTNPPPPIRYTSPPCCCCSCCYYTSYFRKLF